MARGKTIDKAAADLVLSMKARNPKLTTAQIGQALEMDATTAGRIISCGNWEAFCEWKAEKAAKERQKNLDEARERIDRALEQARALEKATAEDEVPGQIRMDLVPKEPAEMPEQVKMMRFLAGQVDKLALKLDHINDTMCQILRAMTGE